MSVEVQWSWVNWSVVLDEDPTPSDPNGPQEPHG